MAAGIRAGWTRTGGVAFLLGFGLMVAAVAARLVPETERLLFLESPRGPHDLRLYQGLIRAWFDGVPVYTEFRHAVQPPALFFILWPIYGWLAEGPTRWLFAGLTVLSLAGLGILVQREARPATIRERVFLAGLILAGYPTAISIGVGQATVSILMAALSGILLLVQRPPSLGRDVAASALLLFALAKPNLTAPFLAVVFIARGPARPLVLVAVGYVVASVASVALHGVGVDGLGQLLSAWLHRSGPALSARGYGNLQSWLGALGLRSWALPASISVLTLHAFWSWRHREADPWTLIGVAAIMARIWAYHRVYDDLLLILPLVALYRLARGAPRGTNIDVGAGILFGLGSAALLAPITPLVAHAQWALVAVWLLQLGFLMRQARPARALAAG